MKRAVGLIALLAMVAIVGALALFRESLFPPPVAAILHYEFDAPDGQVADIQKQLVEAVGRRVQGSGRARAAEGRRIEVDVFGEDPAKAGVVAGWLERPGTLTFRILARVPFQRQFAIDRAVESYPETGSETLEWILLSEPVVIPQGDSEVVNSDRTAVLAVVPPESMRVTERDIVRASATSDATGRPALSFHLNRDGAERFHRLTKANLPEADSVGRQLAIVVDGRMISAPWLKDEISSHGIIAGRFTREEVEAMAAAFMSGPLPTTIRRIGP